VTEKGKEAGAEIRASTTTRERESWPRESSDETGEKGGEGTARRWPGESERKKKGVIALDASRKTSVGE